MKIYFQENPWLLAILVIVGIAALACAALAVILCIVQKKQSDHPQEVSGGKRSDLTEEVPKGNAFLPAEEHESEKPHDAFKADVSAHTEK